MALQKEHTVKGFVGNYWKIRKVTENLINETVMVEISVYKDKALRDASVNNYVETLAFTFPGKAKTLSELYALIKAKPAFEGALDV